jgi:RAT1-interacting protein
MKKPNFNLSAGIDSADNVKKDEKHFEGLDNLLKWCMEHWDQVCGENIAQPNVMTWRGVLTKIMNCPYDNNTSWNICAIKYKGTIYLAEYKTDEQHEQQAALPHWIRRTFYWGRKVENYLTSEKPGEPAKPQEPVNENSEYVCVFRSQLGKVAISLYHFYIKNL